MSEVLSIGNIKTVADVQRVVKKTQIKPIKLAEEDIESLRDSQKRIQVVKEGKVKTLTNDEIKIVKDTGNLDLLKDTDGEIKVVKDGELRIAKRIDEDIKIIDGDTVKVVKDDKIVDIIEKEKEIKDIIKKESKKKIEPPPVFQSPDTGKKVVKVGASIPLRWTSSDVESVSIILKASDNYVLVLTNNKSTSASSSNSYTWNVTETQYNKFKNKRCYIIIQSNDDSQIRDISFPFWIIKTGEVTNTDPEIYPERPPVIQPGGPGGVNDAIAVSRDRVSGISSPGIVEDRPLLRIDESGRILT